MTCELLMAFFCLIGWAYFRDLAKAQKELPQEPSLEERKRLAREIVERLMAEAKAAHNHN